MAKFDFLKRLIKEDFKSNDRELVSKISTILNPALEAITSALTNNLTFEDNFSAQVKEIAIKVDATGKPRNPTTFRSTLKGTCKNIWVTRAQNTTNTSVYPTTAPFVCFTDNSGEISIDHISGLQADNNYVLRIVASI